MKRFRIFLIDDDDEFRESVAELLMEEDYLVDEASNGAKALQMLSDKDFTPDLLLVDLAMPHMHGLELVDRVKKLNPETPIIICSSKSGLQEDFSLISSPQVQNFLTKPVKMEDLLTAIKAALTK